MTGLSDDVDRVRGKVQSRMTLWGLSNGVKGSAVYLDNEHCMEGKSGISSEHKKFDALIGAQVEMSSR